MFTLGSFSGLLVRQALPFFLCLVGVATCVAPSSSVYELAFIVTSNLTSSDLMGRFDSLLVGPGMFLLSLDNVGLLFFLCVHFIQFVTELLNFLSVAIPSLF
jgi:hypothetical protein